MVPRRAVPVASARARTRRRAVLPAPLLATEADAAFAALVAVDARWAVARRDLAAFLAPLTAADLRAGVFRHPVGGWMDVPAVLRCLWVHTHHHAFQLERLAHAAGTAGR